MLAFLECGPAEDDRRNTLSRKALRSSTASLRSGVERIKRGGEVGANGFQAGVRKLKSITERTHERFVDELTDEEVESAPSLLERKAALFRAGAEKLKAGARTLRAKRLRSMEAEQQQVTDSAANAPPPTLIQRKTARVREDLHRRAAYIKAEVDIKTARTRLFLEEGVETFRASADNLRATLVTGRQIRSGGDGAVGGGALAENPTLLKRRQLEQASKYGGWDAIKKDPIKKDETQTDDIDRESIRREWALCK